MNDLSASFDGKQAEAAAIPPLHDAPMIRAQMNRSDWATLLTLAVMWGAAFMFIGVAVREVAPLTYVWVRVTIAAAAMWAWVAWRRESFRLPRQFWGAILFLALANNVVPFILFGWGQTHIASGLASILNATTPIWGVIVAHIFTADEKINARKLAGIAFGFGGVAVMIGPAFFKDIGSDLLAQLACITAALCYAFAGVFARRFRRLRVSPIAVTTGQLSASAIVMLPLALIVDRPWAAAMPSFEAVGAIVALGIVSSAVGYVLYFRLIDGAGATNALLVTLLVPPVAILMGVMFLGEMIEARDIAGLGLIAIGLAAIDGRLLSIFRRRPLPQAA